MDEKKFSIAKEAEPLLAGKKIILGVTGSIAAYKAAALVRLLVKGGAQVRVVMTPLAKEFITPLTMATVSKHPILVDFFDPENGAWNSHVSLGEWADLYLIAPATANTMAKMAHGIADNLLLTTYLSARCPVFAAPAMDLDMYRHAATQENIALLKKRGVLVVEPGEGELASGLSGKGRMAEPEEIVAALEAFFKKKSDFAGVKVLVTAGATVEKIDPVRFISNFSTGKMGYAIAAEFARRGAEVTLVSGAAQVEAPAGVAVVKAESAEEMYAAVDPIFSAADIAIFAAAVADYTPAEPSEVKIKKKEGEMSVPLKKTRDIALEMGRRKRVGQLTVGFALETDDEAAHALDKLGRKNLDAIVLNSLRDKGAGFRHDTNKVAILSADGSRVDYPLKSKADVAADIVDYVASRLSEKK